MLIPLVSFLLFFLVLSKLSYNKALQWSTLASTDFEHIDRSNGVDRQKYPNDLATSSLPPEYSHTTTQSSLSKKSTGNRRICPFYREPGSPADCSCFLPSHLLSASNASQTASNTEQHQETTGELPRTAPVASLYECVRGMPYKREIAAFYYANPPNYTGSAAGTDHPQSKEADSENRREEVKKLPKLGVSIGLNELVALDFEGNLDLKATLTLKWTDLRLRWSSRVSKTLK